MLPLSAIAHEPAAGAPLVAQGSISGPTSSSPRTLFEQGLALYEAERFFEAVERWDTAAQRFDAPLDQALALAYGALGYQKLGRLDDASTQLAESFAILDALHPSQPGYAEIRAKALNIQGTLQWGQGQFDNAFTAWQEAERFYQQAEQPQGQAIAQLNQAKALQALGLSQQAASLLRDVYGSLSSQSNRELQVVGLQYLGSVLRQVGDLEAADALLQEALPLASSPQQASSILLELGNTNREQGDRLQATGQGTTAEERYQAAQGYYQQALNSDLSVEARLNLVSLLIQTGQLEDAVRYLDALPALIAQSPLGRQRIRATVGFADRWLQVVTQRQDSRAAGLTNRQVAQMLSQAARTAQALADRRAESYALGQLGKVYERSGQTAAAQQVTQVAQLKLEGLDAPDIQYQWEWQLGRITAAKGDRPSALTHYEAAVASLQVVRSNLLSINADVQFSFRDNVEPVYREFVELLLTSDSANKPSQVELEKALSAIDRLQLAELENYLGCDVTGIGQVRAVVDKTAASIYPIVLSDRLAIIAQLPGQELSYYETLVPAADVLAVLAAFRTDLAFPDRTPEVIASAKTLYDWLIRPLDADLQQQTIETLVFVPDGPLRNVPMAALFDGEQYLIQKGYATAIAPRLELFLPNAAPSALRVSLGGVGLPQEIGDTRFPTIEKLTEELDRIAQLVETTPPLLNESFTVDNIQQQLQRSPVSAIHWKTHGIFSSDPSQTYIVGYQQRINTATLNELVATGSQGGLEPLELLVLSACETARGDSRAVLGLAGLAARTGTRSVVSALWIALDTPNTEFMVRFYELLAEGMTKAEAVRQAQLALIEEYGYTTPYIWANYILVGNWL
ncbi:MAG: CHAT domain-containing protein [Cyanobacteria bacterium P01_A01_bin.135]